MSEKRKYKYFVFYGEVVQEGERSLNAYTKECKLVRAMTSSNARKSLFEELGRGENVVIKYVSKDEWKKSTKEFDNKKEATEHYNIIMDRISIHPHKCTVCGRRYSDVGSYTDSLVCFRCSYKQYKVEVIGNVD